MLLSSTDILPDKEIAETLGLVKGQVVQAKHIGRDIMAGLKNVVGGEVKSYTDMLSEARQIATDRMIEDAKELNADAIIGIRYGSSEVMEGTSEILAYGTAVKLK